MEQVAATNYALLWKWQGAAEQGASINLTSEVSAMALEIILRAIFDADYPSAAANFKLIVDEPARDWAFAQAFRALRKVIVEITERRRREHSQSNNNDFLDALMKRAIRIAGSL